MTSVDDTPALGSGAAVASETKPAGRDLVVSVLTRRWPVLLVAEIGLIAGLVLRGAPALMWPVLAYVTAVCVTLAAVDVRYHRLPNALTVGSYPPVAALLLIPAMADGRFQAWDRACIACLAVMIVLAGLSRVLGYGAGDAKLAGLLAMPLAWHSWGACLAGIWVGFLMTSVFGAVLLITRRIGRRDRIAAGPPLMAGAYLVLLAIL
ncbi:prepilin peptidase [Catenulispora sp. NL8]|uniref:Prepilin peptidase n=1 Tax=Catenulispora pinistramenti TaxID=2705254 RepID=A0ABS5KGG4_9ACTN|nr:prepilin peptidase [Catenulispora pinistramenti]MBS2545367.1 prepilin peptidase [Catenulispora pinistramenti]